LTHLFLSRAKQQAAPEDVVGIYEIEAPIGKGRDVAVNWFQELERLVPVGEIAR